MICRELGEKEKLVRTCAQISTFVQDNSKLIGTETEEKAQNSDCEERQSHFDTMTNILAEMDQTVSTDGAGMVNIEACLMTHPGSEKIIPSAEVLLELQLESNFPRFVK